MTRPTRTAGGQAQGQHAATASAPRTASRTPGEKSKRTTSRGSAVSLKVQSHALRAIVALYREFEQVARRSDINMAQYRALLILRGGPRRAGEIAATAEVRKSTVSLMLKSLRDRGWVESATDEADRRASQIVITAAGRRRMHAFEAAMATAIAPIFKEIGRDRIYALLDETYGAFASRYEERMHASAEGAAK